MRFDGLRPKNSTDVTDVATRTPTIQHRSGKANGQQMFMSGKIKFKGNMGMVMKLQDLQKLVA